MTSKQVPLTPGTNFELSSKTNIEADQILALADRDEKPQRIDGRMRQLRYAPFVDEEGLGFAKKRSGESLPEPDSKRLHEMETELGKHSIEGSSDSEVLNGHSRCPNKMQKKKVKSDHLTLSSSPSTEP